MFVALTPADVAILDSFHEPLGGVEPFRTFCAKHGVDAASIAVATARNANDVDDLYTFDVCGRWAAMLLKWNMRREKWEANMPYAILAYDREVDRGPIRGTVEFHRAAPDGLCRVCSRSLLVHPPHPFETYLTIDCDGKLFKL